MPLQNKKIKAKGVVVSVAQPIDEAKKMAPKIAVCFTDIQVVVNHPMIKKWRDRMRRQTTEVTLVCVCVREERKSWG